MNQPTKNDGVLMFPPSICLSLTFQRLKDEIAEVTSEIETLGLTEER